MALRLISSFLAPVKDDFLQPPHDSVKDSVNHLERWNFSVFSEIFLEWRLGWERERIWRVGRQDLPHIWPHKLRSHTNFSHSNSQTHNIRKTWIQSSHLRSPTPDLKMYVWPMSTWPSLEQQPMIPGQEDRFKTRFINPQSEGATNLLLTLQPPRN